MTMRDSDPNALLARLVQLLDSRVPGLIAVYRFGSFGTAGQRADSDIDLGLQAERPLDAVFLFRLAGELASLAGRDVDLVDMIRCSTVMRAQIVATGDIVFCRDPYRCDSFAATAFSRYAHLNEARRGILEDIQTRGSIRG
ncbi:MAG: type VII toxin-antitoxin system MntA family adenylyltransferase antitoxin [Rhodanobacteraceae bacterium]